MMELGRRSFTLDDQERFAGLAGDRNPLHVDRSYARRTMLGDVVVHGLHQVLWALDRLYDVHPETPAPAALDVRFRRALHLDEPVELTLRPGGPQVLRLQISLAGTPCTDIAVTLRPQGEAAPADPSPATAQETARVGAQPVDLTIEAMAGRSGVIDRCAGDAPLAAAAPAAHRHVGGGALAELVALSRLVGVECPGLHSLFSSFKVALAGEPGAPLAWRTLMIEPKFSMVTLAVEGAFLRGEVVAFARPRPVEQPAAAALLGVVERGAFAGRRALVIGGSRGLGEVTAKLIAAGGGYPVVTYANGQAEAERIAADISTVGTAAAERLDVLDPDEALAGIIERHGPFDEMYYFATPKIFVQKASFFDERLFRSFCEVYVERFAGIVRRLAAAGPGPLSVLYPSTQALDEPVRDLAEYAAAKAAGEEICRLLARFTPGLAIVAPRLPRLATDQTATLLPVPAADPVAVMLPEIRRMAAGAASARPAPALVP
ncbi:SDR family NAD(P)-dependent oxidoreductase [Salinarimonas soli]|uniref:SDR family NAD(P)-dependent oxidoreductase n=1 Tax=Salinarimonas soli TaxID=1638099 RepID=A0A5B2VZY6_9HYPH|nr:SDR family NAD(P)-dependent oxidoreductase [Salinarimonas soli]KAA2244394.1 SDR family NAD(P)-dependent oxidoreductase [Salinarimonas soli]